MVTSVMHMRFLRFLGLILALLYHGETRLFAQTEQSQTPPSTGAVPQVAPIQVQPQTSAQVQPQTQQPQIASAGPQSTPMPSGQSNSDNALGSWFRKGIAHNYKTAAGYLQETPGRLTEEERERLSQKKLFPNLYDDTMETINNTLEHAALQTRTQTAETQPSAHMEPRSSLLGRFIEMFTDHTVPRMIDQKTEDQKKISTHEVASETTQKENQDCSCRVTPKEAEPLKSEPVQAGMDIALIKQIAAEVAHQTRQAMLQEALTQAVPITSQASMLDSMTQSLKPAVQPAQSFATISQAQPQVTIPHAQGQHASAPHTASMAAQENQASMPTAPGQHVSAPHTASMEQTASMPVQQSQALTPSQVVPQAPPVDQSATLALTNEPHGSYTSQPQPIQAQPTPGYVQPAAIHPQIMTQSVTQDAPTVATTHPIASLPQALVTIPHNHAQPVQSQTISTTHNTVVSQAQPLQSQAANTITPPLFRLVGKTVASDGKTYFVVRHMPTQDLYYSDAQGKPMVNPATNQYVRFPGTTAQIQPLS